jgi:hypothetical protein
VTLVIFTEEASMKTTLEAILPRAGVELERVLILEHQGKSSLESSWRKKLPNWNAPDTWFLVLRDADGGDCHARKRDLMKVAEDCGKEDRVSVRIVCQELEAWFLGDPEALVQAGYLVEGKSPKELRNPDGHRKPSEILSRWKPGRQKVSGAREIAQKMNPDANTSPSFNHAVSAIRSLAGAQR